MSLSLCCAYLLLLNVWFVRHAALAASRARGCTRRNEPFLAFHSEVGEWETRP